MGQLRLNVPLCRITVPVPEDACFDGWKGGARAPRWYRGVIGCLFRCCILSRHSLPTEVDMVVELVRLLLLVCREPVTLLWQTNERRAGRV